MEGKEVFKIWAPNGALWVDWVRPVHFIKLDNRSWEGIAQVRIPELFYAEYLQKDCAVFVDLPDYHAIEEGLALAKYGWRPIALYNGCNAQQGVMSVVDDLDVEAALVHGAKILKDIEVPMDAPPAFLLDYGRMQRFKMDVSVFDNSWDLYSQDVPTAKYFLEKGIDKVVLRSRKIHKDLRIIFYEYQKGGISIYYTDGYRAPVQITIKKPKKDNQ